MKAERFTATRLDSHKGSAVEVPFDPGERWDIPPSQLSSGRRGHYVQGKLNGVAFKSFVVPRARRFFVLVDEELREAAGLAIGDTVNVSLRPWETAAIGRGKDTDVRGARAKRSGPALERIRQICLSLPEVREKKAWGAPTFRVRDRLFVMFVDNHHGDGRLAIWCVAAPGAQEALVKADPAHFFVPPYVGSSGWLGIRLDRRLEWSAVASLVREGYRQVAPKRLAALLA